MIGLHVDPALVALPNGLAETEEELETLILRGVSVAEWAKDCAALSLFKSSDFEIVLEQTGNFPSFDSIRETLDAHGLQGVFSEKDILQSSLMIMQRAVPVLHEFGSEVSQCSALDEEVGRIFERHPAALRQASIRSVATVAWLKSIDRLRSAHFLVSGNPAVGTRRLQFEGSIDDVFWENATALPDLPAVIQSEVATLGSTDDLIDVVTALDVWRNATTASELHLAILAKASRLAVTCGVPKSAMAKFQIGSEFLASLNIYQAASGRYASSTLEACARVVLGDPKYEVNEFGGARPDGMLGNRTHVTKHAAALRLMFWTSVEGTIEFANVGPKAELLIEAGDPSAVTIVAYPN